MDRTGSRVDGRTRLNRERVLAAAVELADEAGIDAVSMRNLAQRLGVVPMALYKHVADKDELLDGMVDVIVGEIDPPVADGEWKGVVRARILSGRRALVRHPWARAVIESRTTPTPAVLEYMNSMIGAFRVGGFTVDLTHHVMHALGSRIWGFTQELFADPGDAAQGSDPQVQAAMVAAMAQAYPYIAEIVQVSAHDGDSVAGGGCDDQFEFEFALDLLLDGFDRLHERGWTSPDARAAVVESHGR